MRNRISGLMACMLVAAVVCQGGAPANAQGASKPGADSQRIDGGAIREQFPPEGAIDCSALKSAYDKLSARAKCNQQCTLECRGFADSLKRCLAYQALSCK